MGLCVASVLLSWACAVGLCPCACDLVLCGSLCGCPCLPLCAACLVCVVLSLGHILLIAAGLVSIGFESYVLKVLSRFYNAIDSGTGKPGAGTARPGGHTPGGGQRPGTGAAGSGVSSRKTEKETKRIFYYLFSIDNNRFKCYTNPTKTTEVHYGIKQYRT